MKRKSPLPLLKGTYLASIVGFGLYWSWVDCSFFREFLYPPLSQGDVSLATIHLFVIGTALISAAAFLLVRMSGKLFHWKLCPLVYACFCASGSVLLAVSSLFDLITLLIPAILLSGVGMALGAILWGYRVSSFGIEGASVCIPGAIVAAALFGMLVGVVIPLAEIALIALFPLLSAAFLPLERQLSGSAPGRELAGPRLEAKRPDRLSTRDKTGFRQFLEVIPLQFMFLLFTFCVAFGIMQYLLVLPYAEADATASQNILVRGLIALVVLMGFGVFSWKPDAAYKIGLLLITAGFLAAPFTKSIAFSSVIIMAGYTCIDMMGWIIVAALMTSRPYEGLRIVAFARVASLGGVCVGSLAGSLLTSWAWSSETNMAIATTAIAYLLVAATVLLFNRGSLGIWQLIKKEPSPPDVGQTAKMKALSDISKTSRLTPREAEVMEYLALGRSLPWIAKRLSISTGTVRSHTRHIYEKLEVHSRQSLMDTIDSLALEHQAREGE
ncbi:MAG: helix-turn-helix transcriptional regulator [Coriobacteriales bacterium]|nr:helix-turn-helix transcriptional regulator [Coriobacteriales bacterium]